MQKNDCPYCGNNPVPHFLNWYFESFNVFFTPFRRLIFYNPAAKKLRLFLSRLNLGKLFVQIGDFLGLITYNTDIFQCKVPRAVVLWQEAEKRGMIMKELLLFGRPFDTYIAYKQMQESG